MSTANVTRRSALPLLAAAVLALPAGAQSIPSTETSGAPPVRTLADAIRRALEVHPSLDAARASSAAAAAGIGSSRATRLPQLAVRGSTVRFQEPMLVAPLHRFDPSAIPDFDETLMQGSLGLEWALFDGGRRVGQVRQARALFGAAQEGVRSTEAGLIQRTADVFLSVLTLRELLRARVRHEVALETELDRARRTVEEGAAPELDRLRAEAELASARAEREATDQQLALAVATLGHLLDLSPGALDPEGLRSPALPSPAAEGPPIDDGAVADPPTVSAARRTLAAAEAREGVARSAWLPSLSVVGGYDLFAGGSVSPVAEWRGGLQVSYPLFTGGARSSGVDASRAGVREARARVEEAREQAAMAVEAARAQEMEARARMLALEAAVTRFTELARVERLALDEGVGVQSDWLRAEAGLLRARAGVAQARHQLVAARIAWARAAGRLDSGRWTEILEEIP